MEFEHIKPNSINELKKVLKKMKTNDYIFNGGTDLFVKLRHKVIEPSKLIDIKGIKSFSKLKKTKTTLSIGATVTLNEIAESDLIKKNYPALSEACRNVGAYQIKNRATISGNICNGSPAADTTPALIIYDAKIKIISPDSSRTVSINEFFKGVGKTILKNKECVESIILPFPSENKTIFYKFSRRKALDLSTVCIAVGLFKSGLRVSVGACAPITKRSYKTEEFVNKHGFDKKTLEKAAELLPLNPISDLRGTKEFRKEIAKKLFIKAITTLKKGVKK